MQVDYIYPFLQSMSNVLATMARLDVDSGKPALKMDNISHGDVSGIVVMNSVQIRGSMAISFPKAVILEVAKRMLQDDFTEIDETITDLVGEITNMVTGGAKKLLVPLGYDIGMSKPIVVAGPNHQIIHPTDGPKICVPFSTEAGVFFVEVSFQKNND